MLNNKINQNPINSNRRKLLSLAGAAGTAALLSPLLSKAAPTTIIEAGSNVDTASYIIFKDGNTIYAKNGTTGAIQFHGEDASTVIQGAIDAISDNVAGGTKGGLIFIRAGTYLLTRTIEIKNNITLRGEGKLVTTLSGNSGIDIISASGTSINPIYYACIEDLRIVGGKTGFKAVLWIYGHIENIRIQRCVDGITVDKSYTNTFINVESRFNTQDGVRLDKHNNNFGFYNCYFNNNDRYGLYAIDGTEVYLVNTNIEYNKNYGILFSGIWAGRISGYFESNAENNSVGDKIQILLNKGPGLGNTSGIVIDASYFNGSGIAEYGVKFGNSTNFCSIGNGCFFNEHTIGSIIIDSNSKQVSINRFASSDPKKIIDGAMDTKIISQSKYVTENNILSETFTIDSVGIKIITIPHGLAITPAKQDCYLTVTENTSVDDWAYKLLKVVSVDAINVIAKINVSEASVTAGATAKLGLRIGKP